MDFDLQGMADTATAVLTTFGLKILGALLAWIVGRYLIGFAVKRLKDALPKIATPPDVEIIDFNTRGPVLAVRAYAHTDHYWQVYCEINRTISETFGEAGCPVPEEHMHMRQIAAQQK